jgi:hypothetical protein
MNIEMKSDRKTLTRVRAILLERKLFVFKALGMCDHQGGLRAALMEAMNGLETDINITEKTIMELRWQTD